MKQLLACAVCVVVALMTPTATVDAQTFANFPYGDAQILRHELPADSIVAGVDTLDIADAMKIIIPPSNCFRWCVWADENGAVALYMNGATDSSTVFTWADIPFGWTAAVDSLGIDAFMDDMIVSWYFEGHKP